MQTTLKVSACIVLACAGTTVQGQSFLAVDADGAHHWASHPTGPSFTFVGSSPHLTTQPRGAGTANRIQADVAHSTREAISRLVVNASLRYGVEPEWVLALIEVESGFDVKAISPKGAIGLMQLMPDTAKQYGVARSDDLFHPETNVSIGVRHLRALLDRHQNNWPLVLAAYNAGENAVAKRGQRIPAFRETLLYVPAVLVRVEAHRLRLDATTNK
jgi:soluble lytic murein transglycosylase-like protein